MLPASPGIQETSFTYCTSHNGPSTPKTLAESTSCIPKLFTMSCIPCHPCSENERTPQNLKRAISKIKVKMLKGSSSNRLLTPAAHPLPDFLSAPCGALFVPAFPWLCITTKHIKAQSSMLTQNMFETSFQKQQLKKQAKHWNLYRK